MKAFDKLSPEVQEAIVGLPYSQKIILMEQLNEEIIKAVDNIISLQNEYYSTEFDFQNAHTEYSHISHVENSLVREKLKRIFTTAKLSGLTIRPGDIPKALKDYKENDSIVSSEFKNVERSEIDLPQKSLYRELTLSDHLLTALSKTHCNEMIASRMNVQRDLLKPFHLLSTAAEHNFEEIKKLSFSIDTVGENISEFSSLPSADELVKDLCKARGTDYVMSPSERQYYDVHESGANRWQEEQNAIEFEDMDMAL